MEKQQIENLLNDIYSQPDLKGGVFSYLQPPILNAYSLLKRDQLSIQTGRTNEVLFTDIEKKIDMENILYRDLPEIIDVYSKMPLEYRNEHRLKNGKTHRELLLTNLELLTQKLQRLEKSAYEGFDQKMAVKSRVFQEKYNNSDMLTGAVEYEPITKKDDFTWKKSAKKNLLNNEFIKDSAKEDNQRIVITEDTVEYKVKNKFKHFMVGTYNVFTKTREHASSFGHKAFNKFFNPLNAYRPDSTDIIFGGFISTVSIAFVAFIGHWGVTATLDGINSQPSNHLVQIINGINLDNAQLRDLSIISLEKLSAENKIKVAYSPNKEMVTLSVVEDKNECVKNMDVMYRSYEFLDYTVNGVEIKNSKKVSPELIGQICQPKGNIVSINKSLKVK